MKSSLLLIILLLGATLGWAADGSKKGKLPFQKSRLTYDESEGVADKRRLLLTTGEDKAVDLDFDVNGTAKGISIGNPNAADGV
jgi:hypothetical protein